MSTRPKKPQRGRPRGARSFDAGVAAAFGAVVKATRLEAGISQEAMAYMASVERSYFGRIERGQSQPTLHVVLKVAAALGFEGGALVSLVEHHLAQSSKQSG
jgi:transcriptional regulator with XRE-family HTH domain